MPRCGGGAPHCKGLKRNCCSAFGRDSSAASCWGSGFTEDRCCTPENAECFPAGSSLRYSDCCPNADCWADGLTFESPLRSPGIRGAEESFKCEIYGPCQHVICAIRYHSKQETRVNL